MNQKQIFIKRLHLERKLLNSETDILAYPVSETLLEWHFTIKGPEDSPLSKGYYHGVIILTENYPFEAPNIYFLTVNL